MGFLGVLQERLLVINDTADITMIKTKEVANFLEETVEKVDKIAAEIDDKVTSVGQRVKEGAETINKNLSKVKKKSADVFDDIRHRINEVKNVFTPELNILLDKLELGVITASDLKRLMGDVIIDGETLNSILAGANLRKFEDDIQSLLKALQQGKAGIGEVLDFLNEKGGEFGEKIAGWVRLLAEGEITLERFRDLVDALLTSLDAEGTALEDLTDQIEDLVDNNVATG